jgi:hypothetical protein
MKRIDFPVGWNRVPVNVVISRRDHDRFAVATNQLTNSLDPPTRIVIFLGLSTESDIPRDNQTVQSREARGETAEIKLQFFPKTSIGVVGIADTPVSKMNVR